MTRARLLVVLAFAAAAGLVSAQVGRGGSEWLTAQGDAQRTSWIRTDAFISVEALSKPGFQLQWTSKIDNQPRQLSGLGQGVTANGVTLFVPVSIVTGSANNVYALDNDTGYVVWQRHFDAPLPAPTGACPGGMTGAATRIVPVAPPPFPPVAAAPGRGGGGRGGAGYRSSLGEPGEGVPVEARGGGPGRGGAPGPPAPGAPGAAAPPAPGAPGVVGPGGRGAAGGGQAGGAGRGGNQDAGIPGAPSTAGRGGGLGRPSGVVYAVTSDGVLHVLGLPSGKDIQKPAPFLPANAKWADLIAVNTTLYASTSQNCGGAPNGVWAIDLESEAKPVVSWKSNGGSVVGGVTFTTDGTVLVAIGPGRTGAGYSNAIVALDPKTLEVKDWYTEPTSEFVTAPLVFRHDGKDMVAAATKDGRVLLLEAASLGGPSHATPHYASRPLMASPIAFAPEALAMWQEVSGTPWLLVPVSGRLSADVKVSSINGTVTNGTILALKIVESAGKLSLQPGWASRDLTSPVTPIIVNGVVFAVSSGRRATPAVVYALNGTDGRDLWNSGKTIASFLPSRSFWSAMGQIYLAASDSTVYAFGFTMERR